MSETSESSLVVGIDLGTTNSEIAALVADRVQVLGPAGTKMLPSCVGVTPGGELLVGQSARNQQIIYPERTIRSVKRMMGGSEKIKLGEVELSPPEVSALILRELAEWGRRQLGQDVRRAVITVPAYFSDAQRTATREAGALAGLEVIRILNEPTAASLAYGYGDGRRRTLMIYDLGGGTFDVSIVTVEGDVTEVLASHGNNRLGGDDFDDLLCRRLVEEFQRRHEIDLSQGHDVAYSRLWWAAEEAKKQLSSEPHVLVREEALVTVRGRPLHLELEVPRDDYEAMIRPLVESTLESVSRALGDAGKSPGDLDGVLLVGGSTRTPLVTRVLEERTGLLPRQDVHPDLCVALGAGVLASRLAGHAVERILVDVSPYSFGPSYLGERNGSPYPYCYHPIIRRNTPLPVTRTDRYFTAHPYQDTVELEIFQGEDPDAMKNVPVGSFTVEGLTAMATLNEVTCMMRLDLDGILHVTATEKQTGLSKHIRIEGATRARSEEEIGRARERMGRLFESRGADLDDLFDDETVAEIAPPDRRDEVVLALPARSLSGDAVWTAAEQAATDVMSRARGLLSGMHDEDKEETIDLVEQVETARSGKDPVAMAAALDKLRELLFFIEGRG